VDLPISLFAFQTKPDLLGCLAGPSYIVLSDWGEKVAFPVDKSNGIYPEIVEYTYRTFDMKEPASLSKRTVAAR
jgi:hypothetical protein